MSARSRNAHRSVAGRATLGEGRHGLEKVVEGVLDPAGRFTAANGSVLRRHAGKRRGGALGGHQLEDRRGDDAVGGPGAIRCGRGVGMAIRRGAQRSGRSVPAGCDSVLVAARQVHREPGGFPLSMSWIPVADRAFRGPEGGDDARDGEGGALVVRSPRRARTVVTVGALGAGRRLGGRLAYGRLPRGLPLGLPDVQRAPIWLERGLGAVRV